MRLLMLVSVEIYQQALGMYVRDWLVIHIHNLVHVSIDC